MEINRREFIVVPAAAMAGSLFAAASDDVPWQRKIRRLGQLNMTEHDPVVLNVEEWADYWASLKIDAVMVSVTGIMAFYQTKVPFHRKGKFLGDRDFFGDCCAAAKKRGIHVIARMSPDLNWEDAVQAHPEWFQRDSQGNPIHHREDARLFNTCMFSTYMTDYMPAIMKEINSLYDVDGLFTNAWPPLGSMPVCRCAECRKLPAPGTLDYWEKFNQRIVYLWKLYDSIAKEKKAIQLFLRESRRRDSFHGRPGAARRTLRVVPMRQPGSRRRRYAHLGMQPAGPRLQRRAEGEDGYQRHSRLVHRRSPLAQRLQVAAGTADVV